MLMKKLASLGVWLLAALCAYVTFFATCHSVMRVAEYVTGSGTADTGASILVAGLFLGFPLSVAAALFVANKIEKYFSKPKDKE